MSEELITKLRKYLSDYLGLDYSKSRDKELYKKIGAAAEGFSFDNTDNFINWLITQNLNPEETQKLATFLTIGETYFLREKKALDYFEFHFLPELIKKRKGKNQKIKIWSAGCASGEEPYTIAIILKRVIPDIKNWDITIMATDINSAFLEKAKKGVYSKWSFRNAPQSFKGQYFKEIEKNKYQIIPSIKKMVKFSYLNLASDSYPSIKNNSTDVNVIFCRNVLIYFSAEGILNVTSKFFKSLSKGGIMLLSPVETSNLVSSEFGRNFHEGTTVYSKNSKKQALQNKKTSIKASPNYLDIQLFKKEIKTKQALIKTSKTLATKKQSPDLIIPPLKPFQKKTKTEDKDFQKALEFYKSGLLNDAEKTISKSIENNHENTKPLMLLMAKIKASQGQLEESEQWCLQAINIDKIDAEAHYLLATILSEQGKESEAIDSLNKTLFLDPNFALGHFMLGNISLNNSKLNGSNKHFKNALKSIAGLEENEILAESDGLTVGRLSQIINSIMIA